MKTFRSDSETEKNNNNKIETEKNNATQKSNRTEKNHQIKKKDKVKKSKKKPPKKVYNDKAKKDTGKLASRINLRMKIVSGGVAACMTLLVVYIGVRSATTNEEYERKALSQMSYSSSTLVAKSGEIYDANMTPIAVSNRVYILIIDPKVILETEEISGRQGTIDATVQAIAQCFDLDADEVKNTIMESADKNYLRYVPEGWSSKKYLVTEEQKAAFDALEAEINGTAETKASTTAAEGASNASNGTGSEGTAEEATTETPTTASVASAASDLTTAEDDETKGARVVGVWFETEYQRYYPYGDLASKVIGFTTKDSTEGIWGLERYYNEELRGTNGRSYSYIDSNENLIRDVIEPTDGYSLVSTIDMNLTKILSNTAKEWINETDENGEKIRKVKSYSILAMDPNTGAVKAMVTDTDYDLNNPNDLTNFYTDEELATFANNEKMSEDYADYLEKEQEKLKEQMAATASDSATSDISTNTTTTSDSLEIAMASPYAAYLDEDGAWDHENYPTTTDVQNEIWRNGIISNSFEPGSTGKVITYAAAIEEGLITEDTLFDDSEGFLNIGRTMVKCHNYATGGCGIINAKDAVAQSCNVAFMEIGKLLGPETFVKYQQLHNLGQKTGIDLPGEASCEGLLYTADQLGELELATSAFGQCYNVTMIQMAASFCADINGGYYYKPYTVESILDQDGNVVESVKPTLVRQVISEETSATVRRALEFAVTDGTVYGVQVADRENGVKMEGYDFGGKTGTAQKLPRSEDKYIISLISAAPMSSPQLVLYVVVDEYEGSDEDGSAPVQYLSGRLWYAIKDYIGLYSELDADVNSYDWTTPTENDSMNGESIFTDSEGDYNALPVPPIAGAVEETDPAVENQDDNIIDPEDALVDPAAENQAADPADVIPLPAQPEANGDANGDVNANADANGGDANQAAGDANQAAGDANQDGAQAPVEGNPAEGVVDPAQDVQQ